MSNIVYPACDRVHSETHALYGVWIKGCCARILFKNTKMRFDNHYYGLFIDGSTLKNDKNTGITLQMVECQFEGSRNAQVVYLKQTHAVITNCTFSNNTGTGSQSSPPSQFIRLTFTVLL